MILLQDPSGYPWQLQPVEDGVPEPFREISLLVSDINRSVSYYCDVLGMRVARSRRDDSVSQVRRHHARSNGGLIAMPGMCVARSWIDGSVLQGRRAMCNYM